MPEWTPINGKCPATAIQAEGRTDTMRIESSGFTRSSKQQGSTIHDQGSSRSFKLNIAGGDGEYPSYLESDIMDGIKFEFPDAEPAEQMEAARETINISQNEWLEALEGVFNEAVSQGILLPDALIRSNTQDFSLGLARALRDVLDTGVKYSGWTLESSKSASGGTYDQSGSAIDDWWMIAPDAASDSEQSVCGSHRSLGASNQSVSPITMSNEQALRMFHSIRSKPGTSVRPTSSARASTSNRLSSTPFKGVRLLVPTAPDRIPRSRLGSRDTDLHKQLKRSLRREECSKTARDMKARGITFCNSNEKHLYSANLPIGILEDMKSLLANESIDYSGCTLQQVPVDTEASFKAYYKYNFVLRSKLDK